MILTMQEAAASIVDSFKRGYAAFYVTRGPPGDLRNVAMLQAGSINAVRVQKDAAKGTVLAMGLTRERLLNLRDTCDEILKELDGDLPS